MDVEREKDRKDGDGKGEVSEFKYLGYVIKKNGGDDGQIRELKRKGNIVMRRIWGLGERLFKDDFRRKMMLFRYLVMRVIIWDGNLEMEGKGGVRSNTKEVRKMVSWPRLLYARLYSI